MAQLELLRKAPAHSRDRRTVYVETTIVSYLTARPSRDLVVAARQQITQDWWSDVRDAFDLFASELVIDEARGGDAAVARRRLELLAEVAVLHVSEDALELAERLMRIASIPSKSGTDALHIAVAAVSGIDYLLTWNCRHIANASVRGRVDAACRSLGYVAPVLCTPEDLLP